MICCHKPGKSATALRPERERDRGRRRGRPLASPGERSDRRGERRADTIKRYLVEKFGIAGGDLVIVGYGKTKLKDAQN